MAADDIPLRISWVVGSRRAHGYLVVDTHALHLIALRDESETAAQVGKATAGQFGLIGGLISAGVSGAREMGRKKDLRELYDAHQLKTLTDRLADNPLSRSVGRGEVTKLVKGEGLVPMLHTAEGPLVLVAESQGVHEAIESWVTQASGAHPPVPVEVVVKKKMNRKLLAGLLLSPVALALLYLLICVPFAIKHYNLQLERRAAWSEFTTKAQAQLATAPAATFGVPLTTACAKELREVSVREQVGLVAKPSPDIDALITESYAKLPRVVMPRSPQFKWDEWKTESREVGDWLDYEPKFRDALSEMLGCPFEWSRCASRAAWPEMTGRRLLLVARPLKVRMPASMERDGAMLMAVSVRDFDSGTEKCAGDLHASFKASSTSSGFMLSQALTLGVMLPGCGDAQSPECRDPRYYATLTEPQAEPVAAPPTAIEPERQKMGASVRESSPTVAGRLSPEAIRGTIRKQMPRIRSCYESALRTDPKAEGTVTVALTISRTGAVSSATAENAGLPASVAACVVKTMREVTFPAPEGGVVKVKYPFFFKAG